jgi:zinc protease
MLRFAAAALSLFLVSNGVGYSALGATGGDEFDFARNIRPETFTLDNGMQVLVISDHRVPVATHMLWYRIGAADEVAGKSGLAHFFEHLLFKGTKAVPDAQYSNIVERNGGQVNAMTSWDFTAYFARVAVDRLPLIMELEADRMTGLILSEEVFLPERDVILEERSLRVDNNPASLFREQMAAALYQNHRYGVPIIGWEHEIAALTQADALAFYRRYYAPNNVILIISGDVTVEGIRPLVEKYYGALEPAELPERIRAQEPAHHAEGRVVMRDARVQQPSWLRYYLVPSENTGEPGESVALEVLSAILGEGPRSRLHRRLVIDEARAVGVGTRYNTSTVDDTQFAVSASPRPGVTLDDIQLSIDEEIAKLIAHGVTKDEVSGAVETLLNDAIFALDSPMTLNYIFGQALTTGGTIDQVLRWPEDMRGVTVESVNAVAQKYLMLDRAVTGRLLPQEGE